MREVTIYTRAWCPYCHDAKALLTRKGIDFTEIEIDKQPERRAEMLERSGGQRTVPQVFVGEIHVGGCDDLYALDEEGGLDPLLAGNAEVSKASP
ncbi:MAG: glutaredoxin 3 [Hyphomicrobiales bacterium]|nr:glutaredoxin 3 [Hyphomicrobiales bacterium]MBV9432073.1 glutaredoxin 3 [Hyphomicrobiales bacterium]MBV9740355.1 glutaredoxin 3 [Hyphomicrobiales bacterium]